jgi:hypothetical protein
MRKFARESPSESKNSMSQFFQPRIDIYELFLGRFSCRWRWYSAAAVESWSTVTAASSTAATTTAAVAAIAAVLSKFPKAHE